MALHPDFPQSPHAILEPEVRWSPADETRREISMDYFLGKRPSGATIDSKVDLGMILCATLLA